MGMGEWANKNTTLPNWFKLVYFKLAYLFIFIALFASIKFIKNMFKAYAPRKKKKTLLKKSIKTPKFPYDAETTGDFNLLLGEIGTQDGFPLGENSFYSLPGKGLATGVFCIGGVGSGKTTNLYPWIKQLLNYRADNYQYKMGGLNLDYKGDMTAFIEEQAIICNREHDLMEFKVGLSSLDKRKIKKLQKQLEDLEDLDSKQALEQYKKQKKTRREEIKLKLEALNESIKKIEILFASGNFSSRNEHGQCLKEKEELLDELDFLKFCSQPEPTESAYNKSINICINPINKVKKTISNRIKRIENIIYWNVVWAPEVSAQVVADMISKAVINIRGKGDKDPFWDISSKDLIRVFVLCLRKIYKNEYFTLDDMNYFFDAENDLLLLLEKHLTIAKMKKLENTENEVEYLMLQSKLEEEFEELEFKNISTYKTLLLSDEKINKKYANSFDLEQEIDDLERIIAEYRGGWLELGEKLKGTIKKNFSIILNAFSDNNYRHIFSPPQEKNDFEGFLSSSIQDGKIIVVNIPMSQSETIAKLVSIFLKLLFQGTMKQRISLAQTNSKINTKRYCFMIADECQFFLTESDPEYLAVSRQSKAINIFLTQTIEQIEYVLGEKLAKVLFGIIRTKLFLGTASVHTAKYGQDLSKTIIRKKERISTSESANAKYSTVTGQVERNAKSSNISTSTSIEEKEEKLFKAETFLNLQLNQAIIFGFDGNVMLPETVLYTIPIYDPVWATGQYKSYFNKYEVTNLEFFRKNLEEK